MIEPGSLLRSLAGRITARNFHSHVINEIGAGVISGRFAVGSILPNDAALMDEFSVSRTVLREALKTLEAKGLVEARPKVGTKVAKKSRWNLYDRQVLAW
ncbi:FadR/GntR family transcriptional regulator [Agrobacterium vitis]|nr:GntR family transcriptional regulator [Agrobacterium vitis]